LPVVYSQSPMSVTASTTKPQYAPSETVTISGKVLDNQSKPVLGAGVSIQANDPQGNTIHVQLIYSDQAGAYSDSFTLPPNSAQGQYEIFVTASKSGFENAQTHVLFNVLSVTVSTTTTAYTTQTSQTITSSSETNVQPKCFIATATYGSELSSEVALLRNFRDAEVLKTSAGRSFMLAFNAFYYGFSPRVASFIASNNYLRTIMKILLYPLIGILYVASRVFTKLAFNPEFAVILAGVIASSAIGIVYLGPIAILAAKLTRPRRIYDCSKGSALVFASCIASPVALALAEVAHVSLLLTIATGVTVLSYLTLGGFVVLYLASHEHGIFRSTN